MGARHVFWASEGMPAARVASYAHKMPGPRLLLPLALLVVASGCGAATHAALPDYDRPIPSSEPQAALRLELSLPPGSDCERRFDLALYRERAVRLTAWDDREGCRQRRITLHYLPRRLGRPALLEKVRELAEPGSVKELP